MRPWHSTWFVSDICSSVLVLNYKITRTLPKISDTKPLNKPMCYVRAACRCSGQMCTCCASAQMGLSRCCAMQSLMFACISLTSEGHQPTHPTLYVSARVMFCSQWTVQNKWELKAILNSGSLENATHGPWDQVYMTQKQSDAHSDGRFGLALTLCHGEAFKSLRHSRKNKYRGGGGQLHGEEKNTPLTNIEDGPSGHQHLCVCVPNILQASNAQLQTTPDPHAVQRFFTPPLLVSNRYFQMQAFSNQQKLYVCLSKVRSRFTPVCVWMKLFESNLRTRLHQHPPVQNRKSLTDNCQQPAQLWERGRENTHIISFSSTVVELDCWPPT